MKRSLLYGFFIGLVFVTLTTSCSSMKTRYVWKDDTYHQPLRKVLVIAVAELDFMRNHFENVLSQSLAARGIEAIPGNKVFPQTEGKLDRQAVLAKVRELGIESVLVIRTVSKKEVSEFPWEYDETETCYILDGEVVVIPENGSPVSFGKGDLVVFSRGLKCRWRITKAVRKHYRFG